MFIMKAFALILVSFVCVGTTNGSTCLQTSLSVKAEFLELSYISTSLYTKEITSSTSFRENFHSLDVSAEIGAEYMGFSASAKAAFDEVTKGSESSSEDHEVEKSKTETYMPNFLQLVREITTQVVINGQKAESVDRKIVDSVPVSESLNQTQLHQLAVDYITREFGSPTTNGGTIRDNTYSTSACLPRKTENYEAPWANGNFNGFSNSMKTCNKGQFVSWLDWYEQSGYGLIDVKFQCSDGTETRMTHNDNGWRNYGVHCKEGFDEMIAREQPGYGIINVQMSCYESNNFDFSNGNFDGFNNNKQSCKPGFKMVGIETQEQSGYGIINFRFLCQNLS